MDAPNTDRPLVAANEPAEKPLPAGQITSTPSPIILSYQSLHVPATLAPGVWADRDELVLASATGAFTDHVVNELPKRCIRCNAPADVPIDIKLVWLAPERSALFTTRQVMVRFWFCRRHANNYRRTLWAGIAVFIAGVLTLALGPLTIALGIGTDSSREVQCLALITTALFMMVLGPVVMGLGKIKTLQMDRKTVRIGGCGEAFLDSLPLPDQAKQAPTTGLIG